VRPNPIVILVARGLRRRGKKTRKEFFLLLFNTKKQQEYLKLNFIFFHPRKQMIV
jgi:hypothetical protein